MTKMQTSQVPNPKSPSSSSKKPKTAVFNHFQKNFPKNLYTSILHYQILISNPQKSTQITNQIDKVNSMNVISLQQLHSLLNDESVVKLDTEYLVEWMKQEILENNKIKKKLFHTRIMEGVLKWREAGLKEFEKEVSMLAHRQADQLNQYSQCMHPIFSYCSALLYLLDLFLNITTFCLYKIQLKNKIIDPPHVEKQTKEVEYDEYLVRGPPKNNVTQCRLAIAAYFNRINIKAQILEQLQKSIRVCMMKKSLQLSEKYNLRSMVWQTQVFLKEFMKKLFDQIRDKGNISNQLIKTLIDSYRKECLTLWKEGHELRMNIADVIQRVHKWRRLKKERRQKDEFKYQQEEEEERSEKYLNLRNRQVVKNEQFSEQEWEDDICMGQNRRKRKQPFGKSKRISKWQRLNKNPSRIQKKNSNIRRRLGFIRSDSYQESSHSRDRHVQSISEEALYFTQYHQGNQYQLHQEVPNQAHYNNMEPSYQNLVMMDKNSCMLQMYNQQITPQEYQAFYEEEQRKRRWHIMPNLVDPQQIPTFPPHFTQHPDYTTNHESFLRNFLQFFSPLIPGFHFPSINLSPLYPPPQ